MGEREAYKSDIIEPSLMKQNSEKKSLALIC